ncbi:MAG: transglutaminase-like domain-containing protein [Peptococcaceae bacterium]|nr:transglutaminase-like domain-containing protein [Peptococcaceae bacterium]MDH7525626.1 transglutaminase-like domain-containing protein [Peptococcaceae bacterium]
MQKITQSFVISAAFISIALIIVAINLFQPAGPGAGAGAGGGSGGQTADRTSPTGGKAARPGTSDSPFVPAGEVERLHKPVYEILGKPLEPFLRCTVGEIYQDGAWDSGEKEKAVPFSPENAGAGRDRSLFQEGSISIKPIDAGVKYIPAVTNVVKADFKGSEALFLPQRQVFAEGTPPEAGYSISFEVFAGKNNQGLRDLECPAEDKYLKLPPGLPDRVARLAGKITAGSDKPYLKLKAIENYLKKNYRLSDEPRKAPAGRDAVDWFLFEAGQGSSYDFNSALVVLARCAGLPARIVTGYRVEPQKEYQVVYEDQLYVYGETRFEKAGWISFDAAGVRGFYTPPVATGTQVEVESEKTLKGDTFTVKGTVTSKDGSRASGLVVLVYLKKNKNDPCLSIGKCTLFNGRFSGEFPVDPGTEVGRYHVVAQTLENNRFRSSWSDPLLKVMSATVIELQVSSGAGGNNQVRISGRLKEKASGKPLAARRIAVRSGESQALTFAAAETQTDGDGNFMFALETGIDKTKKAAADYCFVKKYAGRYYLAFAGDEFHLPAEASGEIYVREVYFPPGARKVITFVVLAALSTTAALYVKKFRKRRLTAGASIKEACPAAAAGGGAALNGIEVLFPLIKPNLPDVWGAGEELLVEFRKGKEFRQSADGYTAWIGETEKTALDFEKESPCFHYHCCFKRKGLYEIKAINNENKNTEGERKIRIVEYREEIMNLAGDLFLSIRKNGGSFAGSLTPRELGDIIKEKTGPKLGEQVDLLVGTFETAAYSLREIKRTDYEAFYPAYLKIKTFLESAK